MSIFLRKIEIALLTPGPLYFFLGKYMVPSGAGWNLGMISKHLAASGIKFETFENFRKSDPQM